MAEKQTNPVLDGTLTVLNDLSRIILGSKKDGTPRSIIDAKIDIEKAKAKKYKKKGKTKRLY